MRNEIYPTVLGLLGSGLMLSACVESLPVPHLSATPEVAQLVDDAPPGAPSGSCWGKRIQPGVYETVTEQIILQPAEVLADGTVLSPAIYKTETRQAVVKQRQEIWFEVPCTTMMTPDFIASVQRALAARGLYRGIVTGEMDNRTRAAIRAYQQPEGLDSGILSLAAARRLGLATVPRDGI
ncbi:peptidoglycan-binding protein [Thalassobius sp. Cn5-15]|uniref:peptidoglycan-binding domain-containing protein n=1 Tax=Thalassobius sp. Cn5-15 TaxID=2917763 RepID=UPI001EF328E1|nr:peptidoglycan-binding protein [Thalassobius sp. Cn5-15]MCG7494327.1 peptidoglycan-binding protein [Thalassobius sp. Cn5-15]